MFLCGICQSQLRTITLYNKHQFIHRKLPNLHIACLHTNCNATFSCYEKFRNHVYNKHGRVTGKAVSYCKVQNCGFKSTDRLIFNKHVKSQLKNSKDGIQCPYSSCSTSSKIYHTKSSYDVHLCRVHFNDDSTEEIESFHKELPQSEERISHVQEERGPFHVNEENERTEIRESDVFHSHTSKLVHNIVQLRKTDTPEATKVMTELFLLLTTKHYTTEPALQEIVGKTFQALTLCKNQFVAFLESSNLRILESDKLSIMEKFNDSFKDLTNSIDEKTGFLRNTYQRTKYYQKNLHLVLPRQVPLLNEDGVQSGFYNSYVPILETLSLMLRNEHIREYCENSPPTADSKGLFDVLDGTLVQKIKLLQISKHILYMLLFQDAFEICNPLGASKKKFKIIAVYMMLLNVPPYLRTKRDNIKLVLLCFEEHVKSFGWDEIFKVLVQDLRTLETDGITISVQGKETTFLGILIAMLGDSLGSHQVGGYTENFSKTLHFCRYCEIERAVFRERFFSERVWRTPETYATCANEAEASGKMQKGVKKNSVLNQLQYYHVANPGLPPCIAHDVFEGIAKTDMWLAIRYFVLKGWFKEGLLNFRLNDIQLLAEGTLYIPEVKVTHTKTNKLTGTASQIRRLVLIFPAAIADVVRDFDDPVWEMVLHLRTISSLICAPAVSLGQIAILKNNIEGYMFLRTRCFPDVPLIPKHEFLFHYPRLTTIFGPLTHVGTLHCECKHGYFKTHVHHLGNFKNIIKTLAERHQLKEAAILFRDEKHVTAENAVKYVRMEHETATNLAVRNCFAEDAEKFISEKAKFRGVEYRKGMCVCIDKNVDNGNFVICRIKWIVINSSFTSISFIGTTEEIVLNIYVGVFESNGVEQGATLFGFPYSSLLSPDPFPEVNIASVPVFLPKYAPYDPDV